MSLHDIDRRVTITQDEEGQKGSSRQGWTIAWCHTADAGGSKRAAFEMVCELAKRGHVVDEYILRIGEPNFQHWPLTPYIRNSYRVNVPPPIVNRYRPYLLAAWIRVMQEWRQARALACGFRDLGRELKARGYDYVHIDHCFPSYTVQLTEHLALPSIIYSHEATDARFQGQGLTTPRNASWWYRKYAVLCNRAVNQVTSIRRQRDLAGLRGASRILTNSCYSKEALFQRNHLTSSVCRYGVNVDAFKPLGLSRAKAVLTAGRIVEKKQHHFVIEAVATIPDAQRPAVIIATPETSARQEDPDYFHRLEQLAKDLRVNLEVRRNPPEQELVRLYNEVMALVFMPIMEPFGLVALEAMACGTPVIGVREGGVRESVVDGVTGILVDRNVHDVGRAIERLIHSEELRVRLSLQAIEYVRRDWVWARTIDSYLREVGSMIGNPLQASSR